jgi:hypothetical protein
MPVKKKANDQNTQSANASEAAGKCGHINRHSIDAQGQHDNLACTKDPGHGGNHGADHLQWTADPDGTIKINKQLSSVQPVWVEWGDMAGTPVEKITIVPTPKKLTNEISDLDDVRALVGDVPKGTIIE